MANNGANEEFINAFISDEDNAVPMANNYHLIKSAANEYAFRRIRDLNTYSICIRY